MNIIVQFILELAGVDFCNMYSRVQPVTDPFSVLILQSYALCCRCMLQ